MDAIKKKLLFRFLQSVPGAISISILLTLIIVILFKPVLFVIFIILFSIYWTVNSVKIIINAKKCHTKINDVTGNNWIKELEKDFPGDWKSYYYCAIIPFASESLNILKPTIESIANSNFPNKNKILCLSSEKAIPSGKIISELIKKEYSDKFAHIFITEHELKKGEMKGKSSNQNHCGRYLYEEILKLKIDPAKILISSNDADVLNQREYHAYLLHTFLSGGEQKHSKIYQPIPADFTGYWEAKFFSRIITITGALWRMAVQERNNYRCTVYSFYSMSLKMLHDINFWDVDLIPEDERTMFNALFKYGRNFQVIPLYIFTSGNPIKGNSILKAFVEQYKQIRRWAWGASEFAHSVHKAVTVKKFDHQALILPIFNQIRTSTEWSLTSLILFFGGFLPGLINPEFAHTYIAHIYPIIMSSILSVSSLLISVIIYFELKIVSAIPKNQKFYFYIFYIIQWFCLPILGILLSALPALEAQTRLIFNLPITYIESKKE